MALNLVEKKDYHDPGFEIVEKYQNNNSVVDICTCTTIRVLGFLGAFLLVTPCIAYRHKVFFLIWIF